VAEPIGLQEGLGILGFCYVPYHRIYDVNFPVLVQFFDSKEVFQFPIAVIIDKNQERKALEGEAGYSIESDVCKYRNQDIEAYTYDVNLNPVEASLKFKCLNSQCQIGESEISGGESVFVGQVPQCVNGFLIASAEGYADSKYKISTNEEQVANIIMKKKYNVSIDLGNVEQALVYFKSEDYSTAAAYPETKNIELTDGYYNISVYVYKNSSLKLQAISERKCIKVPKSGLAGFFGAEEEKCVNIDIPEQEVSFVLVGGGKTTEYLTDEQLDSANKLNLNVQLFKTPATIQDVQDNYLALEDSAVYVEVI
jgi:hypothetical protein